MIKTRFRVLAVYGPAGTAPDWETAQLDVNHAHNASTKTINEKALQLAQSHFPSAHSIEVSNFRRV